MLKDKEGSEMPEEAKGSVLRSKDDLEALPHSIGKKNGGPPSIYMRVPTRVVWDAKYRKKKDAKGLTEGELKAFIVMCGYANNQGFAWPSLQTIGQVIGADTATVSRAMSKAEKLGYLEKVSTHKSHPKWKHIFSTVYRVIYDSRMDTDELIDAMIVEDPAPIEEKDIPEQNESAPADQGNHRDCKGEVELAEKVRMARWYASEASKTTGELRLVNPRAIDAAGLAIEAVGEAELKDQARYALTVCRDIRKPAPLNLLFIVEGRGV